MSTMTAAPPPSAPPSARVRSGRWIDHWEPEDEAFWNLTGRAVARRNLVLSIFVENLGFSIWVLWTIVVLNLGNIGIALSVPEQFWLTAIPNLVGAGLRVPYTFAVPRFGGRAWTTISALLLLIPCTLLAVVVPSGWLATQTHDTQFLILLVCAATAGFGGGNFSSSMANISFFYPERHKGAALGLNAAGGNLGVAVAQLVVPLVIIVGVPTALVKLPAHPVHMAYAGIVWMPFIVVAAVLAWWRMDSLTEAKSDSRSYARALRHGQTWLMSALYIGTFGSFIGYSFALPLVIKTTFPEFLGRHPFIATYLAGLGFLGALVGSAARPFGGWLADRVGGARVTLWCFVGMALFTGVAIAGVNAHSFALFLGAYLVIFLFSGMGNGSAYRMIPAIFAELGRRELREHGGDEAHVVVDFKRRAAAAVGIAGAIGAFGGFLIQVALRQASLSTAGLMAKAAKTTTDPALLATQKAAIAHAHAGWSIPALWVFLGAYLVLAGTTWFLYVRRSWATDRVPSLAYAGV